MEFLNFGSSPAVYISFSSSTITDCHTWCGRLSAAAAPHIRRPRLALNRQRRRGLKTITFT